MRQRHPLGVHREEALPAGSTSVVAGAESARHTESPAARHGAWRNRVADVPGIEAPVSNTRPPYLGEDMKTCFLCAAAMMLLSCAGATPVADGGPASNSGCDGCVTSSGACVPLAQTTRSECGRGGQRCFTCAVCDQGRCSTGWECFGIRPPDPCECGSRCVEGVGSLQCGICSGGPPASPIGACPTTLALTEACSMGAPMRARGTAADSGLEGPLVTGNRSESQAQRQQVLKTEPGTLPSFDHLCRAVVAGRPRRAAVRRHLRRDGANSPSSSAFASTAHTSAALAVSSADGTGPAFHATSGRPPFSDTTASG